MSCGCGDYPNCHDDIRNITTLNVKGACDATGQPLAQVATNLRMALDDLVLQATDLAKASEVEQVGYSLIKAAEDKRYSLGLAYPAMRPDAARGVDGRRDFVTVDVLEKAAWSWMRKSASAGLYHFNGAGGGDPIDGCCEVVESYIYRGPDWAVAAVDGSTQMIKAGDWLLGAIWEESAWPMVKSLKVAGWSPEGSAIRSTPTPHALAELRTRNG